jgi:4-amino-4-deoxy-L-arabinose transferase-like glycosyltransferase
VKRRTGPWWYAASGALFGLAILTRTDLLPVPFLIAGIGALIVLIRQRSLREALLRWGMVAIAAAIVLAPWTIYASREEGRFIPVTKGSAAALFVGTYLPGGGTTIGMKEHLEQQLRAKHPEYKDLKTYKIPAADALELFAAKHPDLPRDQALSKEAKKNLIHYSTTQPVAFAKMQWAKAKRMWFFYYRGGGVHYISTPMRIWQVVLVLAGGLGLLAGLIRRRDPILAAAALTVAFSTFVHTIVVSQARYNVPLMPLLISAGVAGWFLALTRRPDRSQAPATLSEWNSDESESGTAKTRVAPAS